MNLSIFVLKARFYGEEDQVFLFQDQESACIKAYEYFQRAVPDNPEASINDLHNYLMDEDIGFFDITLTPIQPKLSNNGE